VNAIKTLSSRPLLTGLGLGLLTVAAAGIKMMIKKKLPSLGVVPITGKKRAWVCRWHQRKGELGWLRKTKA
jgi:hypothetical protein